MERYKARLVARSSTWIVLSQRHYTLQLLEDTGFLDSKHANVPWIPNYNLKLLMETSLLINLSIDALLVGFFIDALSQYHMLFITLVSLYLNHVSLIYKQLIISFVISKPILVKDFFFYFVILCS